MHETYWQIYLAEGSVATLNQLQKNSDPAELLALYHQLMRHAYWQEKDLAATVIFGRAGIQHGLILAATTKDAHELNSKVKALCYDLASFCWPGWDEPGFEISRDLINIGLDAALGNLQLAHNLNKGPLPLCRATWMLGAQLIAAGRLTEAHEQMQASASWAAEADVPAEQLLATGFMAVIDLLQEEQNRIAASELRNVKKKLQTLENGQMFIDQIETALRIFS